jgi:hypothetical protein
VAAAKGVSTNTVYKWQRHHSAETFAELMDLYVRI